MYLLQTLFATKLSDIIIYNQAQTILTMMSLTSAIRLSRIKANVCGNHMCDISGILHLVVRDGFIEAK